MRLDKVKVPCYTDFILRKDGTPREHEEQRLISDGMKKGDSPLIDARRDGRAQRIG